LGGAGALGGVVLTVAFAQGAVLGVDAEVRTAVHSAASPALTAVMRFATLAGSWAWLTAVTLAGVLFFVRLGAVWRAKLLVAAALGALLLENGLKLLVRRPRPHPYFGTALPVSYAFPSGHALDSIVIYAALATLVSPYITSRGGRLALVAGTAVLVLLIGISRIYLGVHWPSDVLGGWVAGAVWLAVWAIIGERLRSPALSPGRAPG
jgi:undecaprenyl-diphosphatase